MHRKTKQIWWKNFLIMLVFICAVLLVGCFPTRKKTVLTFGMFAGNQWDAPNDDCYKIIDETINQFEKKYPGVEVNYVSGILKEDYSEWLSQSALRGELPDVFMVLPEDFHTFASVGILKNLDTMIDADTSFHRDSFYPACYEAGQFSDSQYALPYESVPRLMLMNKTLLEKEKIPLPEQDWTWEDFYAICKAVTKDTDHDGKTDQFGVYDYTWLDAVYSNGGEIFDEETQVCKLTDSKVERSILFSREIYRLSGYESSAPEDFDLGKTAFRPMSFTEFRIYKPYPWKINKYFDFQWDCIRLPSGPDGENLSETDTLLMGINAKSSHGILAWNFLKELTYCEQVQQKVFQYSRGVSPLKTVTFSENTRKLMEESIGDTIVEPAFLNEVMEHAAKKENIRDYDTILQYMDGEILKLIVEDEDFDSGMQKLKKTVDKMLRE